MTNLDTPKNKTDQSDKKFTNNVKKAAAILFTALGLTVAGQQSANAQMFSTEGDETELAEKKAEGKKLDNTIAEKQAEGIQWDNKNADLEKANAAKRAEIALLKRKKGDKQSKTITREEAKVFAKKD